ncbi:MAG: Cyclic 2, 3-diphosphoglycerate synthetase [Candidatus Methanohalarchaeum thermophilum]|uniref:Cyclic 2, 3-diphosphoglycerate synthetase n=1 Tax=Methanohalarchaeum thermophilum TaxID=1903181 RepID=A0A1Q6DTW5_METT1|nr:MAG: Cyclic 2, 3-diphosphoglycerate synthetase [Candidatus Methanohalarchaeum thermophilum]
MDERVIIMGAAGRDFHDFNVFFRDNSDYMVVAFTHSGDQNLGEVGGAEGREYPLELAGELYSSGIPIYDESGLSDLINELNVDKVFFSYSDVSHNKVMNIASKVLAAGASFSLLGPEDVMLDSNIPVLAIDAVRTGCGKSQLSIQFTRLLKEMDMDPVVVREPMPYGDLKKQRIQRFEKEEDLVGLTVEEREEYEQHLNEGNIVYSGEDYELILRKVEKEADLIIWEGGNNEIPFFRPDVHVVLADALRPGHEVSYHPGEVNFRLADYIVINKENSANKTDINTIKENKMKINPSAKLIHANSNVKVDNPSKIEDKRVLVVEDGPTLTHGERDQGIGEIAAEKYGAKKILDPRKNAVGSIKETLDKYEHIKNALPAIGYSKEQIRDLEKTINNSNCDLIISGTPINLKNIIKTNKKIINAKYTIKGINKPLNTIIKENIDKLIPK